VTRTIQHTGSAAGKGQAPLDADTVRPLVACLDAQIELLSGREAELDALSEAIIANDNDRMEQVLDQMTQSRQRQRQADADLENARAALARKLGWPVRQTRLANLVARVEPASREPLRARRRTVMELAARISLKHRQTAVLLAECTRVNRMLIDCMVPTDQRVTLYGQGGRREWQGGASLMDTEH